MILTNSLSGGGAERSMNLLSNNIYKKYDQVVLVSIFSGNLDLVHPLCRTITLTSSKNMNLLRAAHLIIRFNRIVWREKPDLVILNCSLPELLGAFLFHKLHLVVVEHSSGPWVKHQFIGKLVRYSLKLRHANWVSVSDHLRIWPGTERADASIPNSIEPPLHNANLGKGGRPRRLVFVGRLSWEKRPEFVLNVSSTTNLPFLFIGSGDRLNELQMLAKSIGAHGSFLGHQLNPWEHIREGDVLLVPSLFEGDGLTVLEGMQLGIPMLLADIPAFRRFGIPEQLYCDSETEFVEALRTKKLIDLIVPKATTSKCMNGRKPEQVSRIWTNYIDKLLVN